MTTPEWRNWSGHVRAWPVRVVAPANVDEVAGAVKDAVRDGLRLKAAGSGHSFSEIAAPDGLQLRLDRLARLVRVDTATGLVTAQGGIPLHRLNPLLAGHGLAMENLGDIDRQTITGAISTGTHGTGARFGGIATQVQGLELVLADGSVVSTSAEERPELLEFARVGLGALGVITKVTLRCVPSFALHVIDEPMPLDRVLAELDELVEGNDHFEFFWFPYTDTALTRRFRRLPADTELRPIGRLSHWFDESVVTNVGFGTLNRIGTRFPGFVPRANRIVSGSLSRREYTDLSHRVFASRRDVRFNEGEYAFPRERFVDVVAEVRAMLDRLDLNVAFPFECRFVAADDIPLAPTYRRTSAYLAFHQYHAMPYRPFFDAMEDIFAAVEGRPHWGKMHRLGAEQLRTRYPRFDEFVALRDRLDPTGVFTNPYLDKVLGPPPACPHRA
ncbi:D-arabinono-1,4-lactone oxidase [Pseudonocardia eucalypti]|uniref:D-arabinono-1,4-lactone oxidase n=1 Tax=Pseudonocardia eucalypti TaxID=648755 RepID=A0ABP9RFN4_9PSEU|nr:FAD-linked oxidoreductase [Pseudonocardia eucalypti]